MGQARRSVVVLFVALMIAAVAPVVAVASPGGVTRWTPHAGVVHGVSIDAVGVSGGRLRVGVRVWRAVPTRGLLGLRRPRRASVVADARLTIRVRLAHRTVIIRRQVTPRSLVAAGSSGLIERMNAYHFVLNGAHTRQVVSAVRRAKGARAVALAASFDQSVLIGSGKQRRVLRATSVNGVRYDAAGLLAPGGAKQASSSEASSSGSRWNGQELVIGYATDPDTSVYENTGQVIHGAQWGGISIGFSYPLDTGNFQAYTSNGVSKDPQGTASFLVDDPFLNYSLSLNYNEHDQSKTPISCSVNNSAWTCSDSRTEDSTANPNCWNPNGLYLGPYSQEGYWAGINSHCGWAVDDYTFTTA